jgi:hypothetical protein
MMKNHVSIDYPTMIEKYSINGYDFEEEEDFPLIIRDKFLAIH